MSINIGTAKSNRWTYPAVMLPDGKVMRSEKRNGSGASIEVTNGSFVSTKSASVDYALLRELYGVIFSDFAITADELRVSGISEKRGLELVRYLEDIKVEHEGQVVPLVVRDNEGGENHKTPIWQSFVTYDSIDLATALVRFDAAVPLDIVVKERRIGRPVINNTHKKPGRSTWTIGSECPQGHCLGEGDVYVMPSGRKQCRSCRKEYSSNI